MNVIDGSVPPSRHWQLTQRLSLALLLVWFVVTFGLTFFARDLNSRLAGWPLSFWLAGQGAPIVYLLLIWCYSLVMDWLDRAVPAGGDA